jgi:hypothetical protein
MRRTLNLVLASAMIAGGCSQALPADGDAVTGPTSTQSNVTRTTMGDRPSTDVGPVTTTIAASTTSVAVTTTSTTAIQAATLDATRASGLKSCREPYPIPTGGSAEVPEWVVGIHTRVTTLVGDMNAFAVSAWEAAPNESGWSKEEPVASALERLEADLTDLHAYSEAALEGAGLEWTKTGWTEIAGTEGPMVEGPIWWLPEGIWSKAEHLNEHILPAFVKTTGAAAVQAFYINGGATSAGPCATTVFMVEAVNGIIGDLE